MNPYTSTKGLVYGEVLASEERQERDRVLHEIGVKQADETRRKADAEREILNARVQELYGSVNKPIPVVPPKKFFGGSQATTKRVRVGPLDDNLDGIIGTIEAGVMAVPKDWPKKISTRRSGAKLKGISG